jgi:hypothetical protein
MRSVVFSLITVTWKHFLRDVWLLHTLTYYSNTLLSTERWKPHHQQAGMLLLARCHQLISLSDASDALIDNNPDHVLMLCIPEALIIRNEDSSSVASGAVAGGQEEAQPEDLSASAGRHASASPLSPSDIRFCTQCHGPREYCHGHESPAPTPVPAPVTPTPVPAPSTCPLAVGHFHLTREEAMSLADNIANTLEVCREDTPEVPPPYPERNQDAEGMGL